MMRDGVCSPVVLCIILAREFAVSGLRMVAAGAKDGKVIAANMWGKVKTVLQMLSIIFYFFGMSIASMSATGAEQGVRQILVTSISMVLCWLVAAVTAISGIKYLWEQPQLHQHRKIKRFLKKGRETCPFSIFEEILQDGKAFHEKIC